MKKVVCLFLIVMSFIPNILFAQEKDVNIYLFYGDGCPHCKDLKDYLDDYLKDNKNLNLYSYEVWNSEENLESFKKVTKLLGDSDLSVPYLVIGNTSIKGFGKGITEETIENTVNYYNNSYYKDNIASVLNLDIKNYSKDISNSNVSIKIKNILKDQSDLLITIILSFIESFKLSNLWIILVLFLILICIKDDKKKLIICSFFLITNMIVKYLFLTSNLDILKFTSKTLYIRTILAFCLITIGIFALIDYFNSKNNIENNKLINFFKKSEVYIFILIIILFSYSSSILNINALSNINLIFNQFVNNRYAYAIIYILINLLSYVLFMILFFNLIKIKKVRNKINGNTLISSIALIIIGFLLIYIPKYLMFLF